MAGDFILLAVFGLALLNYFYIAGGKVTLGDSCLQIGQKKFQPGEILEVKIGEESVKYRGSASIWVKYLYVQSSGDSKSSTKIYLDDFTKELAEKVSGWCLSRNIPFANTRRGS